MKEKQKTEVKQKPFSNGGDDIFLATPEPENKNVSVSSGPYIEDVPVAGMTVGEVRKKFADRFDIDKQSKAIIDGKDAPEDVVLKAGESLMFIRHAGEKGAGTTVALEDTMAIATTPEGNRGRMKIGTLVDRMGAGRIDTGSVVLPDGIRSVMSRGNTTIWVWEKAPCIQKLSWIREDSPSPYGGGAKYRDVRIALPYLVIFAVFAHDENGMPYIAKTDECFFRTEPIKSLDDELSYPALLNCSKFNEQHRHKPLSWICTQYLKTTPKMSSSKIEGRYAAGFDAVRYCLLETSFNLSSEHHEGNSWYGASKKIDPRIATIKAWEEATNKDPMFVLDMPWIKTHHSVRDVAERIFERMGSPNTEVKSANDVGRIIFNGNGQ